MSDRFHRLLKELADEYDSLARHSSLEFSRPHSPPPRLQLSSSFKLPAGESDCSTNACTVPNVDVYRTSRGDTPPGEVFPVTDQVDACNRAADIPGTVPPESEEGGVSKLAWDRRGSTNTRRRSHFSEDPKFQHRPLLPDKHSIKEAVRQHTTHDLPSKGRERAPLYKDHGWAQRIVKTGEFDLITTWVVVLNILWLAVDADLNSAPLLINAHWVFQVVEHTFCFAFTVEWVICCCALRSPCGWLCHPAFMFDTLLVLMIIFDTWVLTVIALMSNPERTPNLWVLRLLRIVRITRLTRFIRVIQKVQEIVCYIKGMFAATRAVATLLGLLAGLLYVFGIILRQLSDGTDMGEEFFSTVPHAIFTLFVSGTLLDEIYGLMVAVAAEDILCAFLIGVVILVAAMTMMNMLIGILCEVISTTASVEREELAINFVKSQLEDVLNKNDVDDNRKISMTEFECILRDAKAVAALEKVGVDPSSMVDFAEYFFMCDDLDEDMKEISFDEFVDLVMRLRGDNYATVRDVVDLKRFMLYANAKQQLQSSRLEARVKALNDGMEDQQVQFMKRWSAPPGCENFFPTHEPRGVLT